MIARTPTQTRNAGDALARYSCDIGSKWGQWSIINFFNRLAHGQAPSLSLAYLPQMALTDRGLPIFSRSLSQAFVTELSRLSFEAIASFQAADSLSSAASDAFLPSRSMHLPSAESQRERFSSAKSSRSSLAKERSFARSSATACLKSEEPSPQPLHIFLSSSSIS